MDFEFDKEIDFLLRQTAQNKAVSAIENSKSEHLDADEISAFSENALPEKTRQNYILHLADCELCRKNLSGLIALNAENQSEMIHTEAPAIVEIIAPKIPWYRRLFAVPNLAYAMGALILVFAGIGVFTIIQSNKTENSQVSLVSEKQIGGKGMSSDGATTTQEVYSNRMSSNSAAMNSTALSNSAAIASNSMPTAAPTLTANSNTAMARREPNQLLKEEPADEKTLSKPGRENETAGSVAPPPPPPPAMTAKPEELPTNGRNTDQLQPVLSDNAGAQNQTSQNQTQITPDTRNVQRAAKPSAKARQQEAESVELKKSIKDKSDSTTIVGGKSFTRANNIWIDSAYRGQATTNISRGTKEYKKLDSALRGIVENLGGTVIIVWKERAYRIQ